MSAVGIVIGGRENKIPREGAEAAAYGPLRVGTEFANSLQVLALGVAREYAAMANMGNWLPLSRGHIRGVADPLTMGKPEPDIEVLLRLPWAEDLLANWRNIVIDLADRLPKSYDAIQQRGLEVGWLRREDYADSIKFLVEVELVFGTGGMSWEGDQFVSFWESGIPRVRGERAAL